MTYAAAISYFLTHEASSMDRDAMIDLLDAQFPSRQDDDLIRGLHMGVATLQQEAEQKGEFLDVRDALARLAKIPRREVDTELVFDIASFPTGISTALH